MTTQLKICILVHSAIFILNVNLPTWAGDYTSSAHGNTSYGVSRLGTSDFSRGNCSHCHDQHASREGTATSGPYSYALFADNFVDQTTGVCFECHTQGGVVNRSYSFRAGDWDSDPVDDIEEFFALSGSAHNLNDILLFLTDPDQSDWGYNANSNPCAGCHNPHAAQGDPADDSLNGNSPKAPGTRGYPISRPSQHGSASWGLWGDGSLEQMDDYTDYYQAPYRYDSTSTYEPDGSTNQDGSNLTDINSFCLDCHSSEVPITNAGTVSLNPDTTPGYLTAIDWGFSGDKHGKSDAEDSLCTDAPYSGMGKVLSCLDCHEPHGSSNPFLLRKEINGDTLADITDYDGPPNVSHTQNDMRYVCNRCHMDDYDIDSSCFTDHYKIIHHHNSGCNSDAPYTLESCTMCHTNVYGPPSSDACTRPEVPCYTCVDCHYHGANVDHLTGDGNPPCESAPPAPTAVSLPAGTPIF